MLLHIQQYDESTLEQISRAMVIDKSVTTRGISKFLEQGWVEKKSSLIDKRAYHISLTAIGEQIVEELNDKLNKWNDYLAADLTEQDAEQLFGFLDSLAKNAVDISIKDFPERFTDNQE
nr:MarR family winged helix-turn-helix transcriptional regulator [Providencia stuartii]